MNVAQRRRALSLAAVTAATLAVPAAAHGADYTVASGAGGCGAADLQCGSLAEAAGAVQPGDSVQLPTGIFEAATFDEPDVTIRGAAKAIGAPPSTVLNGTMRFTGAGAPSTLDNVLVGTNSAEPAVAAIGTANVDISDAIILSVSGSGVRLEDATSSSVRRTRIFAGGSGAGIDVAAPAALNAPTRSLTLGSVILAGGGDGLRVKSSGLLGGATVVDANHITVAGSANGIVLDASEAPIAGGAITMTARDSIVQGTNVQRNSTLLGPSATLTLTRTDTTTPAQQLFVRPASRDFSLLFNAPVIDKGAAASNQDDLDVDGQPRTLGVPTDLGADEFVNTAPTGRITVAAPQVRQTRPATFSAAGSFDREGPLTRYEWTFSDGTNTATTTPSVSKAFNVDGPATASLVVVDASGSRSAPVSQGVTVTDGLAPLISIDKPTANQTLRLTSKRTRTVRRDGRSRKVTRTVRNRISFSGRSLDRSGVREIQVAIRRISRVPAKKKAAKPKSNASQAGSCLWVSPNRGILRRSCSRPVSIKTKLAANGSWTYTLPVKRKLVAGTYEVIVAGVDKVGIGGNLNPRSKTRFKLR